MELLTIEQMEQICAGDGINWDLIGCLGGLVAAAGAFAGFIAASGGSALAFFATCSTSMLSDIAMAFGCGIYLDGVIDRWREKL